eukprot:TCONS_00048381-protein
MSSVLQCPITALKCFNNLLLTGQKSKLLLYNVEDHNLLVTKNIFQRNSVHKFCEITPGEFLVIGGKSIRRIKIDQTSKETCSVHFVSKEKEFKVWVWDGIHLEGSKFLLISIHNTTFVWDSELDETLPVSSCQEQCILYSARLQRTENEILVAAGTVFNQILLWKTDVDVKNHVFVQDMKRFCGHEGVIFSIRFHPRSQEILSVSDDRSIRIWDTETTECLQVLYGHTARVWDAMFVANGNIVSIGEDATCIVWDRSNVAILKKHKGHKGKSIWSMEIDQGSIYTGGGDGGIRKWPLDSAAQPIKTKECMLSQELRRNKGDKEDDFPRIVKFITPTRLLVFTNNGFLLSFDHNKEKSWVVLHEDSSYYTYCVLDCKEDVVAFGNLKGMVKLCYLGCPRDVLSEQIFGTGKVYNLLILNSENQKQLLACGPEGELKLYTIEFSNQIPTALKLLSSFILPHSKQRWVTNAILYNNPESGFEQWKLVCGDRRGSLHLFDGSSKAPLDSALGVHGKTGVTSVVQHGNHLFTTGRDGNFRKYHVTGNKIVLVDKQKVCKGLDWIEGIWFHEDDVIVYGFYLQSYFGLWSYEKKEILLKIQCGGGYRSWDVSFPNQDTKTLQLAYLKGPVVNIASCQWNEEEQSCVFKEGLHGKEVVCAKLLGYRYVSEGREWLMATGSEDTTINFVIYKENTNTTELIHTAVGHIGGVKDITFMPSSQNSSRLSGNLISCGSRTSLKKWYLDCPSFISRSTILKTCFTNGDHEASLTPSTILPPFNKNKTDLSCCLATEIFNPEMNPKQLKLRTGEFIDDMRYMSCDVWPLLDNVNENVSEGTFVCACACSDGAVRIYLFDGHGIEMISLLGDKKHCFQTVKWLHVSRDHIVMATSTDGHLSMWNLEKIFETYRQKLIDRNQENQNEITVLGEKVTSNHVNKNRFKFHELEEAVLLNTDIVSGEALLCFNHKIHQSGINSIDVVVNSHANKEITSLIVATGGDDNALSITNIQVDLSRDLKMTSLKMVETKTA